jgi:hypothetical protein
MRGTSEEECVRSGSPHHDDLGKIGIPDGILMKPVYHGRGAERDHEDTLSDQIFEKSPVAGPEPPAVLARSHMNAGTERVQGTPRDPRYPRGEDHCLADVFDAVPRQSI